MIAADTNPVEAAYPRTDLLERMRALMEQYAAFLAGKSEGPGLAAGEMAQVPGTSAGGRGLLRSVPRLLVSERLNCRERSVNRPRQAALDHLPHLAPIGHPVAARTDLGNLEP